MSTDIILSICIPTFNRAKYLDSCLRSIFDQNIETLPIEVIVSDNFSTDHTKDIIYKYNTFKNFKSNINNSNIGMSMNILNMVKFNAVGKYCWIIGDDDFILHGMILKLLETLKSNEDIDFFFTSIKHIDINSFLKIKDFSTAIFKKEILNFEFENIENVEQLCVPPYSQVFLGEIMSSIFRRSTWLEYNEIYKTKNLSEFLTTLENSYPHCVIYANKFFGKRAIYFKTPLIMVLNGAREWWDKAPFLVVEILRELVLLYMKKIEDRKLSRKLIAHYFNISFGQVLRSISNKKNISIKNYSFFVFRHIDVFFITLVRKIIAKKKSKIIL